MIFKQISNKNKKNDTKNKDYIEGEYKDLDDGQYLDKKIGDITKMIAGYSGLQRLWWTKMIYRKYLTETLTEFMDPAGYRRRQIKARNDAINARFGIKANNVLFDKLLPDFD